MCDCYIKVIAGWEYIKSASSLSKGCGYYITARPITGMVILFG